MVQKKNIPVLWEEESSDVWMVEVEIVEVESEAFLNDALDTYQVVKNIVDSMMDTVDAHNVVRSILFDIINTINTLTQLWLLKIVLKTWLM